MKAVYSILHLSDLHRSIEDPISNEELISSLQIDMQRYTEEDPLIRPPDAIIISGDIVQGVLLGTTDHKTQIQIQYDVAYEFFVSLSNKFLDGDRSRLIFVPGNHDIDWNVAKAAMQPVPDGKEPTPREAFKEDSVYRWDWKSRSFFKIVDQSLYEQRLDLYWKLFDRFYEGVARKPVRDRDTDYAVAELFDGKIVVVAFNSCRGNDCYALHGSISRQAIAQSYLQLSAAYEASQLWVAVWHHNIEGPPYRTDYMDIDSVRNLIGRGFRLGIHGHQHRNQAEPRHIFLPDQETMAVISAGSLCAGPKELPTGFYRQYNIIELAEDLQSLRVHVRQMETAQLFSKAHLTSAGGRSYVDLQWKAPREIVRRSQSGPAKRHTSTVLKAEQQLKTGKPDEALRLLEPLFLELDTYGRTIFFEAALSAKDWDAIISKAQPPLSIFELTTAVEACDQTRQIEVGKSLLKDYAPIVNLPDGIKRELESRLTIREMQGK